MKNKCGDKSFKTCYASCFWENLIIIIANVHIMDLMADFVFGKSIYHVIPWITRWVSNRERLSEEMLCVTDTMLNDTSTPVVFIDFDYKAFYLTLTTFVLYFGGVAIGCALCLITLIKTVITLYSVGRDRSLTYDIEEFDQYSKRNTSWVDLDLKYMISTLDDKEKNLMKMTIQEFLAGEQEDDLRKPILDIRVDSNY
ncbi:unnamed protein product [Bursaphelenchus okinawaensis]|uniref:Uncharacterized protein n=1 Tax=Bursaphelenchus okinawaensis TaxID=465554 RepID=A0A811L907_9BILA|nr:unnamed protein product [Bursaphelenchus okinawaensis]CAG9118356.1 unnamed protein product [Bursaphelenchus okinawaensis]